jgi:hypothetical protein
MQAYTFTFKFALALALLTALAASRKTFAADGGTEDILHGPYSEYGEFDSGEDEDENEKFFQYGRFFGVGLGAGVTTATGNAGRLYTGSSPMVDLRINYWFDFHFALQMDVQNSKHSYNAPPDGLSDVNLFRTLLQVKYYLDTHDLAAPISFISPNFILGGGFYQRTDNIGSGNTDSTAGNAIENQNTFGLNGGIGFELTLKPKRIYLQLEGLVHMAQFRDDFTSKFRASGIPDRTGYWVTGGAALMWTW